MKLSADDPPMPQAKHTHKNCIKLRNVQRQQITIEDSNPHPARAWRKIISTRICFFMVVTSELINATGSQRWLSSQPRFIEVANPREQPYSGIKKI